MQLAWEALKEKIGENVKLSKNIICLRDLNSNSYSNQINAEDYIALYGTPQDVRTEIKKQMLEKFGQNVSEEKLPQGGSYLLYSYLQKHLPFKMPFQSGTLKFKNQKVQSFFGNEYETNKQAELVFYGLEDGLQNFEKDAFIIRLNTKDKDEEIIIAKMQPEKTLKATYEKVNKLASKGEYSVEAYSKNYGEKASMSFPIQMGSDSYFEIPKFDFKINHSFTELIGNNIIQLDKNIDDAQQMVRFKLDEYGAALKSETVIYDSIPAFNLPWFKVNDRFLIYIKQKNAKLPYLVIWVDNSEILIKNEKTK
jgi:hypothetical protein